MILCDKCNRPMANADGFTLINGILGSYRICHDCSLALDRFVGSVERAKERRAEKHARVIR